MRRSGGTSLEQRSLIGQFLSVTVFNLAREHYSRRQAIFTTSDAQWRICAAKVGGMCSYEEAGESGLKEEGRRQVKVLAAGHNTNTKVERRWTDAQDHGIKKPRKALTVVGTRS